ncbi:hypothetical protein WDV93_15015, partial [Pantoea ananatis]
IALDSGYQMFGCLTFGFYRVSLVFAFIVKRFRVFVRRFTGTISGCFFIIPAFVSRVPAFL